MYDYRQTRLADDVFERVAAGTVTGICRDKKGGESIELITIRHNRSGQPFSLACFSGEAGYGKVALGDEIKVEYTSDPRHVGCENRALDIRIIRHAIDL